MRIFVTGATGFIGSVVVAELISKGHDVTGLARSDTSAATLAGWGARAVEGTLADTEALIAGAKASEGVIHLGFTHDGPDFFAAVEADRVAVEALAGALEGSDKPLVIASGTLMVAHARPATETDRPLSPAAPRAASEALVMEAAAKGVRGAVVRLSPSVHDRPQQGLVTMMIAQARQSGVSAYVGDGENRWPAVHRADAAHLFVLALEGAAPGSVLHAVAEEGVALKAIAEAIGEGLGVPVASLSPEEVGGRFGFGTFAMTVDNLASSAITRETLGWAPAGPTLLEGLRSGAYLEPIRRPGFTQQDPRARVE
jgi:nucleoside-diphosphate-sugar epimerase